MPEGAAVDTDILLKMASWRLADVLLDALAPFGQPAALGLTHLIAGKQLRRLPGLCDVPGARAELESLLARLARLEPTEAEVYLASTFVDAAILMNLPLDRGEAQLTAVLITRGLPFLVTGDKRAIEAINPVLGATLHKDACRARVVCLEQVLLKVIGALGFAATRDLICSEPNVDGSAKLCFGCGRESYPEHETFAGLISHIADVQRKAPEALRLGGL